MEEENGESEREFPGLYTSEASYRSDSDYNDNSYEKGGKKELLKSKKKEKKDLGYAALDAESSGEEMDYYLDIKNPLKSKRPKSFKFLQKRDKEEKEEKREDKKKKEKDEKDDKKKERKKEKEEKKLRLKEEKKKIKKDKKKKGSADDIREESCPLFGVPLCIAVERCPSHDGIRIPAVVRECIDFVEEKGLNCEGIYRLGGVKTKVQSLRRAYNSGDLVSLDGHQPHVVASLLKQFLRELPETILTVNMMPHFEDVSLIPNPRERAEAMRQLIDRLPTPNRLLLQYVLKHMGHVVEREKETKMSNHSVCIVLSPTMQISHRVLNVMFHSHTHLFGDVGIKKYIPPITSHSGSKSTLDDLLTSGDIQEEMRKQESLLASLHAAIANGSVSQSKEEQLWEAQRIVTLLKRKLKVVHRWQEQRSRMESFPEKELSSEESQKEMLCPSTKPLRLREDARMTLENDEDDKVGDVKSSSETDTAGTPSFKTASNVDHLSRKSSCDEDSDKSQASSTHKKEDEYSRMASLSSDAQGPPQLSKEKERMFPILPKPFSARAERNKLAQSGREKMAASDATFVPRKNEDSPAPLPESSSIPGFSQEPVPVKMLPPRPIQYQNMEVSSRISGPDTRRFLSDKETLQKVDKMSEIIEDEVTSQSLPSQTLPPIGPKERRYPKALSSGQTMKKKGSEWKREMHSFTEDTDYAVLLQEDARLALVHEELLAVNQELTRKLQAEKTEISRLRDEIQEMQTLYAYRTHSYDSSESEGSESEGESDTDEELFKEMISIDRSNKQIKMDNSSLTERIQDEREILIQLRVALRQVQQKSHMVPQPPLQVC